MAITTTDKERVNTTFIGYILMGFILLLIGVFGLQCANFFGDDVTKWPLSIKVFSALCSVLGFFLVLLTVFAYRTGERTSAVIFAIFGFSMFAVSFNASMSLTNSNWFMYIAIMVLFIVLAIYSVLEREPMLVHILLVVIAATFLFLGVDTYFDPIVMGPGNDVDLFRAFGMIYGIIAFVGFAIATYLGLAYSHSKKLPIF